MKTVAVVTATTGRVELQQAIDSVARQTYPCRHYIFFDASMDFGKCHGGSNHGVSFCDFSVFIQDNRREKPSIQE